MRARASIWAIPVALAIAAMAPGARAQLATGSDRDLAQPSGRVAFAIMGALVAPTKSDGRPWDGMGQLTEALITTTQRLLRLRQAPGGLDLLFDVARTGDPTTLAITEFGPDVLRGVDRMIAPPDVMIRARLNGQPLALPRTGPRRELRPSWSGMWTESLQVGPNDILEIEASDQDLAFPDPIGVCTSRGMPFMNRDGYASARTFTCQGQLLGVAVVLRPEGPDPFGAMPRLD